MQTANRVVRVALQELTRLDTCQHAWLARLENIKLPTLQVQQALVSRAKEVNIHLSQEEQVVPAVRAVRQDTTRQMWVKLVLPAPWEPINLILK